MNNSNDLYLRNLGIGEVWKLRQTEASSNTEHIERNDKAAASIEVSAVVTPSWDALRQEVKACQKCGRYSQSKNPQFGIGEEVADIFVINLNAAWNVDSSNPEFYLGQAKILYLNILKALTQDQTVRLFQTALLKCDTLSEQASSVGAEAFVCNEHLKQQILLNKPKVILIFGEKSANVLLGSDVSSDLAHLRKHPMHFLNVPVVVTHTPEFLINSASSKRETWTDLCLTKSFLS
jgi:uracil-DNA glycosylase family 4